MNGDKRLDPTTISDWLKKSEIGTFALSTSDGNLLTAMTIMSNESRRIEIPSGVLTAWRMLIIRQRRTVDQSEANFIDRTRKQGWTWSDIAKALGLADAYAAERHQAALIHQLEQTHPSVNPGPWLP